MGVQFKKGDIEGNYKIGEQLSKKHYARCRVYEAWCKDCDLFYELSSNQKKVKCKLCKNDKEILILINKIIKQKVNLLFGEGFQEDISKLDKNMFKNHLDNGPTPNESEVFLISKPFLQYGYGPYSKKIYSNITGQEYRTTHWITRQSLITNALIIFKKFLRDCNCDKCKLPDINDIKLKFIEIMNKIDPLNYFIYSKCEYYFSDNETINVVALKDIHKFHKILNDEYDIWSSKLRSLFPNPITINFAYEYVRDPIEVYWDDKEVVIKEAYYKSYKLITEKGGEYENKYDLVYDKIAKEYKFPLTIAGKNIIAHHSGKIGSITKKKNLNNEIINAYRNGQQGNGINVSGTTGKE